MNDENKLEEENINEEIIDLGLATKDIAKGQRLMNKDGTFNGRRTGLPFWETINLYHYLVGISWFKFMVIIIAGYVVINFIFALIYYIMGVDSHLLGVIGSTERQKFLEAFFFSFQSFTTVGYGRISPIGTLASGVAAFESLIGLLTLAIATGLFYGRFSKPESKILYSSNALIAPFKNIKGLQFRIANKQGRSEMIDVEIRLTFTKLVFNPDGTSFRKFYKLELEYDKINFFPLTWTVNHPITEDSPMYGMTEADLQKSEAEFFILLQGFDDMFSTTVNSRYSYRYDEIVWGAKFVSIYKVDDEGRSMVELDKIDLFEKVS